MSAFKVDDAIATLIHIGKVCYSKNWSLATSSNYSLVLQREPLRLLMTASGKDKSKLVPSDFVIINERGNIECGATDQTDLSIAKASAETMLHIVLAKDPMVGAVLHTHSVYATVLSARHATNRFIELAGYEMLKALRGVTTHDTSVRVPIFSNSQDIDALAEDVVKQRESIGNGFLIDRHGLYATGASIEEAMRHMEAFEFLFEVAVRSGG